MTKIMVVSEHSTTHMEAAAMYNCIFDRQNLVEFKQAGIQHNKWMNKMPLQTDVVQKYRLLRRQFYIHVGSKTP